MSFGPKELAFQWAQRQAVRRGFGPDSGKMIQIVTDGDEDLGTYTRRYFPKATHTLDIYHALEYVWQAGSSLHAEGSPQLDRWYRAAREKVFGGKCDDLLDELRAELLRIPRTGPGNKGRRERLQGAINYLTERVGMMNYKWLADRDLEIGSGAVEGAVKHLVALRFDHGGMRWIRERAQANEVRVTHGGMDVAVDEEVWQPFQSMSTADFAARLKEVATNVRLDRFKKSRRGPKKPPPLRNKYVNETHVSTARLLTRAGHRS